MTPQAQTAPWRRVIAFFFRHTWRYKWPFLLHVGALIFVESMYVAGVEISFQRLVDAISGADLSTLSLAEKDAIWGLLWRYVLSMVSVALGWRVASFSASAFKARAQRDIRHSIMEKLLAHSASFFHGQKTGALISKSSRLGHSYITLMDQLGWELLPLLAFYATTIGVLFGLRPQFAWIFLTWSVVFITATWVFIRYKHTLDEARARLQSRLNGVLADIITHISTVQSFGRTKEELTTYEAENTTYTHAHTRAWHMGDWLGVLNMSISQPAELGLTIYMVWLWFAGQATVGELVLIVALAGHIGGKLRSVSGIVRTLTESMADATEMFQILETPTTVNDIAEPVPAHIPHGEIVFDHVSHTYEDTNHALKNISVRIHPGETIALVGPSGAGKSTFMKLLLRLADPTAGRIFIDGINIAHMARRDLRHHLSFVPQSPLLFHRTLRENILYGHPSATEPELIKAATLAHAHDFISALPNGYDTLVGERGVKLSGGERQRVALARALIKPSRIALLDEATSALDSVSEAHIQDAFQSLSHTRTTIVIAHRLSTVQHADRIFVFDNGQILEQGTHPQLLAASGLYAQLWGAQHDGFLGDTH